MFTSIKTMCIHFISNWESVPWEASSWMEHRFLLHWKNQLWLMMPVSVTQNNWLVAPCPLLPMKHPCPNSNNPYLNLFSHFFQENNQSWKIPKLEMSKCSRLYLYSFIYKIKNPKFLISNMSKNPSLLTRIKNLLPIRNDTSSKSRAIVATPPNKHNPAK